MTTPPIPTGRRRRVAGAHDDRTLYCERFYATVGYMAWYPAAERYSTPWTYGKLDPVAVICHRTYGREPYDMEIATGKARKGISFHFYVTKKGAVRQFVDTSIRAAHAKGANAWSIGIEVESLNNDDAMTPAQMSALGGLVRWLHSTHKIPLTYDPGPQRRGQRPGFLAHASVSGSDHGDRWSNAEWDRIVGQASGDVGTAPQRHVDVPALVDSEFDVAQRILRSVGLQARRNWVLHGLQKGRVVGQSPPAGTVVEYGSYVDVSVDKGAAMNVVNWQGQLHTFNVEGGDIWHRWWDGKKWLGESVCGPRNTYHSEKGSVRSGDVTAVVEYGTIHVFAGAQHAWWDTTFGKWNADKLP